MERQTDIYLKIFVPSFAQTRLKGHYQYIGHLMVSWWVSWLFGWLVSHLLCVKMFMEPYGFTDVMDVLKLGAFDQHQM